MVEKGSVKSLEEAKSNGVTTPSTMVSTSVYGNLNYPSLSSIHMEDLDSVPRISEPQISRIDELIMDTENPFHSIFSKHLPP